MPTHCCSFKTSTQATRFLFAPALLQLLRCDPQTPAHTYRQVFRVSEGAFLGVGGRKDLADMRSYHKGDGVSAAEPIRVSLATDGVYAQVQPPTNCYADWMSPCYRYINKVSLVVSGCSCLARMAVCCCEGPPASSHMRQANPSARAGAPAVVLIAGSLA